MPVFTKIKNFTDEYIGLPVIGKIRLGTKRVSKGGKEYPYEENFFVLNPDQEVEVGGKTIVEHNEFIDRLIDKFGPNPTELYPIMFPIGDQSKIFPQAYRSYGFGGLRCTGNGEFAYRKSDSGEWEQRPCTCGLVKTSPAQCAKVATLYFMIPDIAKEGFFAISTRSVVAMHNINRYLAYLNILCELYRAPISKIKVRLLRKSMEITYVDRKEGKMKKSLHFPMEIVADLEGSGLEGLSLPPIGETKMISAGVDDGVMVDSKDQLLAGVDTDDIPDEVAESIIKDGSPPPKDPSEGVDKIVSVIVEKFDLDEKLVRIYLKNRFGVVDDVPDSVKGEIRKELNHYVKKSNKQEFIEMVDPTQNGFIKESFEKLGYPPAKVNVTLKKFNYDTAKIIESLGEEINKLSQNEDKPKKITKKTKDEEVPESLDF